MPVRIRVEGDHYSIRHCLFSIVRCNHKIYFELTQHMVKQNVREVKYRNSSLFSGSWCLRPSQAQAMRLHER